MTEPPPRPRTEAELPFTRRAPVQWFSPKVLARSGLRVVLTDAFGVYLDKRELQAGITFEPLDGHRDDSELWIDYVSDTGDGFGSTYTIAWLVAQRKLGLQDRDETLPRASVLVLGGDEVYPVADATEYEDRFVGPYQAALPWTREPENPELFVLPGNHDWYDGLTSFMRLFCQGSWVGGWRTPQKRSYFAVALPHRWWLWGIDVQLDAYIDEVQARYFREQAERLDSGDRIILCSAKPSWVDSAEVPLAYRNLAYFEQEFIQPKNARVMLALSGDSHHYAHYADEDGTHKITAGGGGAFLHPTHDLPEELHLPPKELLVRLDPKDGEKSQRYTRGGDCCFPRARDSRLLALKAVGLPFANPSFMLVTGVLYTLLLWANQFGTRMLRGGSNAEAAAAFTFRNLAAGLFRTPLSILLLLIFVGALVAFAQPRKRWEGWGRVLLKSTMGLAHAVLQLGAVVVVALVSFRLASSFADGGWLMFWFIIFVALLGGVVGGVVVGLYLILCILIPGLHAHRTEAFSCVRLTGYKNFLRLHIDDQGVLRVYPIGLKQVLHRRDWKLDPGAEPPSDGKDEPPWYVPKDNPPDPFLIEKEPIVIDGR
ncbi:MAG: metallophosphoesterase [Egibacteraceae bacterium]